MVRNKFGHKGLWMPNKLFPKPPKTALAPPFRSFPPPLLSSSFFMLVLFLNFSVMGQGGRGWFLLFLAWQRQFISHGGCSLAPPWVHRVFGSGGAGFHPAPIIHSTPPVTPRPVWPIRQLRQSLIRLAPVGAKTC